MEFISFQQLLDKEAVTKLYAEYQTLFDKVSKYYSGNFREKSAWSAKIKELHRRSYDRNILHRILNEQNRDFHSGIKTLANIDLLGNEDTFAVVTGQQLGLFGGPLYTIYKAVTAVKLAERLSADFPEYNFVPVFWLEGEDHDFDEINAVRFPAVTHEVAEFRYQLGGKPLERNVGATGAIILDDHITGFLDQVQSALPQTEFTPALMEVLRGYYKPGTTMLKAFAGFINHFYEDSGLIFINAADPSLKKVLTPLFEQEIRSNAETSQRVIRQSVELEEHYHAQIKAKALNLFLFYKGGRHLIEPSESGDYFLKNLRQRYTKEELLSIASTAPEMLSPNVVLRPIAQDTLLPTAAYVAGPGEIAYYAQLKPVYELFSVPMPLIYPRASVTLIEEKVQKVLEKYSLDLEDLFGDVERVLATVSEQVSEVKVDAMFAALNTTIQEAMNEARYGIQQIDPTLNGVVDGTIEKFRQQLDILKQKTQKAQQQKEDISLKQIRKASANIFPNGEFQEREFGVVPYLNKYGPDFVKWVANELVIDKFQHQVITL